MGEPDALNEILGIDQENLREKLKSAVLVFETDEPARQIDMFDIVDLILEDDAEKFESWILDPNIDLTAQSTYTNRNQDVSNWLFEAADKGSIEIVKMLIAYGADVKFTSFGGTAAGATALHCVSGATRRAICEKNGSYLGIARLLLEAGADPNARSTNPEKEGITPIHLAALSGATDICELLVENGAKLIVFDFMNESPLSHAARNNHCDTVRKLVELGANPWLVTLPDVDLITRIEMAERENQNRFQPFDYSAMHTLASELCV